MVNKCIIIACRKLTRDGISFHKLPTAEGRKKWIDFIQTCNSTAPKLGSGTRVCARHFKTCCFELIRRNRAIKAGHFPTQIVGANGVITDSSTSSTPHLSPEVEIAMEVEPSFDDLKEHIRILQSEKCHLEAKLVGAELKLSSKNTQLKALRKTIARLRISKSSLKSTVIRSKHNRDTASKSCRTDACTNGNCLPMEDTMSSTISQRSVPSIVQQIMDECQDDVPDFPAYESLSIFVENVVVYIAGFVGKKVNQMLDCAVCQRSLNVLEPSLCLSRNDLIHVKEKQSGGLFVASPDLIAVCKITEQEIRCQQSGGVDKLDVTSVLNRTLSLILQEDHFQDLRSIDMEPHTSLANHVLTLLKLIVSQYCKIRFDHFAKVATLELNPISIGNN